MLTKPQFTENLQRAFASLPGGSRCENCPEPEDLRSAVQGNQGGLSVEQRREIVRHTAVCAACAEDWRITRDFLNEQKKAEDENLENPCSPIPGHPSWFGENLYKVAAAALVVLAAGVGGWFFHQTPDSNFRGEQRELQQVQSGNLDGATLPRDNFVLQWVPTPGATYTVFVMNQLGDQLKTERGLESARFRVSPEILQELAPGDEVLWQVDVVDPQKGTHRLGTFTTYVD